jgi:EmrB/QacA subfamily drug resistance transporter
VDDVAAVGELRVRRTVTESRTLAVAAFGAFLAFLDATIVNVAFPSIRRSFPHASLSELSWIINAYNIVFAASLVASGRLADLIGRRRAFRTGVIIFVASSLLCAVAWSIGALIAFRCLQAIGAAMLVPASLAVVVEAAPPERRAHAVGLWGAAAAAAGGLGPPIGGALVELRDWRLTFLVNLPLGAAALVATRKNLVESRAPGRRTLPDLLGTALLGAALGAATLGIVQGSPWGWTSPGVITAFVATAVCIVGAVQSSRRHPSPVLDPRLLRIQPFAVSSIVTVIVGMGFYAYLLNHILWLTYIWHYSILEAGLAVAPGAFVAAIVAGPLGRIADERGHKPVIVSGALIWALAFVWYVFVVGTEPHFLTEWLPGQILSGIGVGATMPVLGSAGIAAVPGARFATASAALSSARQLGGVLGIAILVVIIGTPTAAGGAASAFRHGWVFTAVCFLVGAVAALFLGTADPADEVVEAVGAGRVDVATDDALHALRGLAPLAGVAPEASSTRRSLDRTPFLGDLPPATRRRLTAGAKRVPVVAGKLLFAQGDAADALYVVASGRLEIVADGAAILELGPGAVIGELGLLTNTPRAASVRARRDSEVLRISRRTFDAALADDPKAPLHLARALARQVQASRPLGWEPPALPTVVAVVGLGTLAPTAAIAELLVAELRRYVTVGTPGTVNVNGLERAERDYDRVVLVAEHDDDPTWKSFCLGQADRVVLVADDPAPPATVMPGLPPGSDLMIPTGELRADEIDAWQQVLAPRRSHPIGASPSEWPDAIAALGRRVAGRSVGLALAGGGARALAHVGVIEELLTAGVVVDRVSGCSLGAYVAALFARGLDADAIDARCYEDFVRSKPYGDYTIPTVALSRGQRGRAMMQRAFGDLLIEQLPRQFVCVSTDLLTRELVVHDRGLVRDAVGASMSLPALVPPYRLENRLLIDGGVLDNLPVSPLARTGEGPVIAVNIGAAQSTRARGETGPRVPALGESLMRVLLMSSAASLDRAREEAAVMVTPDTRGVGLLEFHQIDRMREAGRAAGRAALDQLGL